MTNTVRYLLLDKPLEHLLTEKLQASFSQWRTKWGLNSLSNWQINLSSKILKTATFNQAGYVFNQNQQLLMAIDEKAMAAWFYQQTVINANQSRQSPLLQSLYQKSITDFCEMITTERPSGEIATDLQKADGAMQGLAIEFVHGEISLSFWVSLPVVDRLAEDYTSPQCSKPIASNYTEALSQERITLNIDYGSAMISVEDLAMLQVGDVICLDQSVSEPLKVRNTRKEHILNGFLGQNNQHLALKITR